jgi:transcriptional regulator of acetoin/glycerol metabolism
LSLETVDHEVANMKYRVLLVTGVEITLISLFIIFFTRRFLGRPIERIMELAHEISSLRRTVLIPGESGTGKEMVARAIHGAGDRAQQPFSRSRARRWRSISSRQRCSRREGI